MWANPGWQRLLQWEDGFDRADWGCRQEAYTRFIGDLGPGRRLLRAPACGRDFARRHAAGMGSVERYWRRTSAGVRSGGSAS